MSTRVLSSNLFIKSRQLLHHWHTTAWVMTVKVLCLYFVFIIFLLLFWMVTVKHWKFKCKSFLQYFLKWSTQCEWCNPLLFSLVSWNLELIVSANIFIWIKVSFISIMIIIFSIQLNCKIWTNFYQPFAFSCLQNSKSILSTFSPLKSPKYHQAPY